MSKKFITSDEIILPEKLYKYRDWNDPYHKKVITDGEIFIASPNRLNDPFDCNIQFAYQKFAENEVLERSYLNDIIKDQFPYFSKIQHEIEVNRLQKLHKDPKWIEAATKNTYDRLSSKIGIVSFSELYNNILMWSHYGNSHKGFCIGIKSRRFLFEKDRKWGGGPINYVDEYPVILPTTSDISDITTLLFTKHSMWGYEKEYRLIRTKAANTVEKIYEDDIAEIIIGYAMSEKNQDEIIKIAESKYPSVPIFKMKPAIYKFELIAEKIK